MRLRVAKRLRTSWQVGYMIKSRLLRKLAERLMRVEYPYWVFAALAIVVIFPLLSRGYVIHFDMVFSPNVHFDLDQITSGFHLYSSLFTDAIFYVLNLFLPMYVIEKLVLFGILFLPAAAMYRFNPASNVQIRMLAAIFYGFNPFVHDRLMAGHWKFLVLYALLPAFLYLAQRMLTAPKDRDWLRLAALWAFAALFAPHALILYGLLLVVLAVVLVRKKAQLLNLVGVIVGVLILSSWWLLPALFGNNVINTFTLNHLQAFATQFDATYGVWFTLLSLQGFWHEGWLTIKDHIDVWPIVTFIWIGLSAVGFGGSRKSTDVVRKTATALFLVSLISIWLAAGLSPESSAVNSWLFENIPGFSGLREPQKFIALVVLAMAYLMSIGLETLVSAARQKTRAVILIGMSVVLLLGAWPMAWAGHGELSTSTYPTSWAEFNSYIQESPEDIKFIALPWSLYIRNEFSNSLVAHPAKSYFGEPAVVSNDVNLVNVAEYSTPERDRIKRAVERQDYSLLVMSASALGASYVMVPIVDNNEYQWLLDGRQGGLFEDEYFYILPLTLE